MIWRLVERSSFSSPRQVVDNEHIVYYLSGFRDHDKSAGAYGSLLTSISNNIVEAVRKHAVSLLL